MKKKILIGVGLFIVLLVVAFFYLNHRNRSLSPPGSTSASNGALEVTVDYSRPSVRGRMVFGYASEGALQPYGEYWRLGANEPTRLTANQDFMFGESRIASGTYDLYAVPGPQEFRLVLNTGNRFWGYTEPDYDKDVAEVTVPLMKADSLTEQFTINAANSEEGVMLYFQWDVFKWEVLIEPQ